MIKRSHLIAGALAIAASSVASQAALVTYTLALNDNGTGTLSADKFAIYADVTDGAGLVVYGVSLTDATGTFNIYNRSPKAVFTDLDAQSFNAGFTNVRSANPSALGQTSFTLTGSQDVTNFGTTAIAAYNLGVSAGNITSLNPDPVTAGGVLLNTGVIPTGGAYAAHLLIATGSLASGTIGGLAFNTGSVNNVANVFTSISGTAAPSASVAFNTINLAPSDVNELVLATVAAPTVANGYVANAGTVNVVSSGAFTSSNVVTTDADKKAKGKVNISWPGEATSGPVWVMMWVTGTGVLPTPAGSTALYTTASHAGAGTMWDVLEADYSAAGGGAFNYLAYYANGQSAPTNGFYYDLVGTGLSLDKIAVVPEPASLGLLALGALGLLSRKRR